MEHDSNRKDLEMMVLEIKMGTERVYSKLEQLSTSVSRLEGSLSRMDRKVDDLEKKLLILDQSIPDDLVKDITLLKNSQENHSKMMWLLGSGLVAVLTKIISDLIMH